MLRVNKRGYSWLPCAFQGKHSLRKKDGRQWLVLAKPGNCRPSNLFFYGHPGLMQNVQ